MATEYSEKLLRRLLDTGLARGLHSDGGDGSWEDPAAVEQYEGWQFMIDDLGEGKPDEGRSRAATPAPRTRLCV